MDEKSMYNSLRDMKGLIKVKDETIREMSNMCSLKVYENEETLFLEGSNINNVYIIYEGMARVSRLSETGDEKIIHILSKGHFINEMSLDERNTSTTVTITEGSKLIVFLKADIIKLMEKDFQFNLAILKSLASKLRSSYRQIRNLGLKKINSRIAARLCKLARDYGHKEKDGISININLTQGQFASMVGTRRESVSRFLKQLEREKIIQQNSSEIKIIDFDSLKEYI